MSDCCHQDAPTEVGHCATQRSRPDWFLWAVVAGVAGLYVAGLVVDHGDGSPWQFATLAHGVVELFNMMWWGLTLGVVLVGLLPLVTLPQILLIGFVLNGF